MSSSWRPLMARLGASPPLSPSPCTQGEGWGGGVRVLRVLRRLPHSSVTPARLLALVRVNQS
jgi:hypothetical protein